MAFALAFVQAPEKYPAPDLPLAPRVPISPIVTAPLSPSDRVTPLGTFTLTRIQ